MFEIFFKPIMAKFITHITNLIKDTYGDYLSSLPQNPAAHVGHVYTVTGFQFSGMGAPFHSFLQTESLAQYRQPEVGRATGWV